MRDWKEFDELVLRLYKTSAFFASGNPGRLPVIANNLYQIKDCIWRIHAAIRGEVWQESLVPIIVSSCRLCMAADWIFDR